LLLLAIENRPMGRPTGAVGQKTLFVYIAIQCEHGASAEKELEWSPSPIVLDENSSW
jgi:hypothetical protein